MLNSLFAKLTLALLLIFILLSILTISVTFVATDLYQKEVMQKLNDEVASHIVKETEILQQDNVNHLVLNKLFHSLMVLNPSLEIYLLDHEGEIMAFSAPPQKVVRDSVNIKPIKRYLSDQSFMPIQGDDPRNITNTKVFSVAVVPFTTKPDGYLYVILGGEEYDSILERIKASYILSSSLVVIFIGLLLAFIISMLLFVNFTRRLKKLAHAVNEYELNPQLTPIIPEHFNSSDEIDCLTIAFQTMALKIHCQFDELQTTDRLRRELIANVSHDLRTPLATLQGYIETLLIKENIQTDQERHKYLETAIKHCNRLNQLVSELFELASLDANETTPQWESFNLAELTEDIIQKFSLRSQDNTIQWLTQYTSNELFVYADIALIERVLENLLENSLRYVDKRGSITIALEDDGTYVQIKVSDDGIGIPESELPFIFDRFYQLDKNRSAQSSNSGLGLAIVKRIVELHQSIINVSSIPNQKTMFSFSLPSKQNITF